MKPENKNAIKCIEVSNPLVSYFEDGSIVPFKINIDTSPNIMGKFYGEVVFYSPTSKNWVIIWFGQQYETVPEAFEECWSKQQEFIKNNPTMAC